MEKCASLSFEHMRTHCVYPLFAPYNSLRLLHKCYSHFPTQFELNKAIKSRAVKLVFVLWSTIVNFCLFSQFLFHVKGSLHEITVIFSLCFIRLTANQKLLVCEVYLSLNICLIPNSKSKWGILKFITIQSICQLDWFWIILRLNFREIVFGWRILDKLIYLQWGLMKFWVFSSCGKRVWSWNSPILF